MDERIAKINKQNGRVFGAASLKNQRQAELLSEKNSIIVANKNVQTSYAITNLIFQ
jgi:hypothetical protein